MLYVLLGEQGLPAVLAHGLHSAGVDEKRFLLPQGVNGVEGVRLLASFNPPNTECVVLSSVHANYVPVVARGWRVIWVGAGSVPVGCESVVDDWLGLSVGALCQRLWGVDMVADSRLVFDVLTGRLDKQCVVVFVSSASGGVGKSVNSRRLCELASALGVRACLVDANFTQDSQRSFFDSAHRRVFATVDDFRDDVLSCVTQGSVLGVGFDVVFAGGFTTSVIDRYVQVINRLRSLYGLIVVDMDRFGAQDVSNRLTVAGGLLVPCLLRGDRLLFVSRVGMQSSRDSVNSLRELLSVYGLSHGLVAVVDAVPYPVKVTRVDWSKVAVYAGEQPWSARVEEFISRASLGWSDENLDTSRNRIMRWLFPDMKIGEDNHSKSKKKKKRSRQSKVRSHRA